MSGLAEACCCDSLQRHTTECPGANIAHKLVVVVSVKMSQQLQIQNKMQ